MSDFGDKSGVYSSEGYEYQRLIAAYYLIVEEAREIEYEADGEDVLIINEGPNRDSLEYIQVKHINAGSFTLSKFTKEVFPQFWIAFSDALTTYHDKGIYCTLVTNVAWHHTLKRLIEGCKHIHNRGITLLEFEKSMNPVKRAYDSMKSGKNNDEFRRFLWGLDLAHSFTLEHVKDKMLSYMKSCGISEPRKKLALITNYISDIGQGRITRRQIEDIINSNLAPIERASDEPIYSEVQVSKILSDLGRAKSEYMTEEEFPDDKRIYRDMTHPVDQASKVIQYQLGEKSRTSDFSSEEIQVAREIILSDAEKAREEAQTIASLRWELWSHKTRYTQRISSMQKTANDFGINI